MLCNHKVATAGAVIPRGEIMAMVGCRECGNQVSDSAPTCTKCGITSPGGLAQLEVRRASRLWNAIIPMAVWVDSVNVGTLTAGKSLSLTVSPGVHRIECGLQHGMTKDAATEVQVPAGRRLVVVVAPSRVSGKPSFSAELA